METESTGKKKMFAHPFSFSGRIRRLEYGLTYIINFVLGLITGVMSTMGTFGLLLGILLFVASLWFGLAQQVKRCHDRGQSGWMILTLLIPLWNIYYGLVLLFGDGDKEANQYGESPKY